MRAFKFIVRSSGLLAVAVAADEQAARARLEVYAEMNGYDARWLSFAEVIEIDIDKPSVLGWAQLGGGVKYE